MKKPNLKFQRVMYDLAFLIYLCGFYVISNHLNTLITYVLWDLDGRPEVYFRWGTPFDAALDIMLVFHVITAGPFFIFALIKFFQKSHTLTFFLALARVTPQILAWCMGAKVILVLLTLLVWNSFFWVDAFSSWAILTFWLWKVSIKNHDLPEGMQTT